MHDNWTEKLSDYIDGELAPAELAPLESHLASCGECRAVLDELRRVVLRAENLTDSEPATDLWAGVAARIGAADGAVRPLRTAHRHFEFSLPQLAAAAVALMIVSAGVTTAFHGGGSGAPVVVAPAVAADGVSLAASGPNQYDLAIAEMEQALEQGREHLDPETVRVLRENLAAIDAAIMEARGALAVDPGSAYLNSYLARTMRRKMDILERGTNLIAAASL